MNKLNRKLLRDLKAMRYLVAAIAVVIVLGTMVFGGAVGAYRNLAETYDLSYRKLALADLWIELRAPVSSGILNEISRIPGVQLAVGRSSIDLSVEMAMGDRTDRAIGHLMAIPDAGHPALNDYKITAGDFPQTPTSILLERNFAAFHDLTPGDTLSIKGPSSVKQLHVAGTFTSPEYIVVYTLQGLRERDFAAILAPQSLIADLLGTPANTINEVLVKLAPGAQTDQVSLRLEETLSPFGVTAILDRDTQPGYTFLNSQLMGLRQLSTFFPILFLSVASLATYALLNRIVRAQRLQIGTMLALGVSARSVRRHYLLLALVIGALGALVGALGAIYLNDVLTQALLEINNGAPFIVTGAHWETIVMGIALSLFFVALAGWGPARQAASVPPAVALRTATTPAARVPRWIQRLSSAAKWPTLLKLPLRNLFRQRGRTVGTAIGVALALILVLISATYFDSVLGVVDYMFKDVRRYDVKARFTAPLAQQAILELLARPDVQEIAPIIEIPVRIERGGESYSTLLVGLPSSDLYRLYDTDERPIGLPASGVLLGNVLKKTWSITAGEPLKLFTPFGDAEVNLAGFVYQPRGASVFLALDQVSELLPFPRGYATGVMLNVSPNAVTQVVKDMESLAQVAFVQTVADEQQVLNAQLALYNTIVAIMAVLGVITALAILFNTTMVNVLERRKELATMRMLGTRQREVTIILTLETLVGGLGGVLPGIVIGYQLAVLFFSQVGGERTSFLVKLSPPTYGLIVAGSLVVLLLAQWPGLRHIGRLDLSQVAKEQGS